MTTSLVAHRTDCADPHEGQPVAPVANVRTRNPGGVSRRSESTRDLSECAAMTGEELKVRFRTMS